MRIKLLKKMLALVFLITILVTLCNISNAEQIQLLTQKNILILHSYNEGTAWTKDQNDGIMETIDKAHENTAIYVEYMDWKNYSSTDNLEYLYDYYKFKYENKHLDLIITTDDSALSFALKYRSALFSDAPIVFSGINQDSLKNIDPNYKNYTGIIEDIDPTETIKIALKINPNIKKVFIVFDNSESGLSTGKIVTEKIKNMNLEAVELNDFIFNGLLELVKNLNNNSMVFFATYYSDVTGDTLDFSLASREISRYSAVPLYHQYDFGIGKGAIGGNVISGRLCGNSAAELALRILNGESADSITPYTTAITKKMFDYEQIKRFNIPIKKLPSDAEIINKPFSFFETYRKLVIAVIVSFAVLLCFVFTLLAYIKKIKKIEKELFDSNEELTQTYEELLATDEQLKIQLNEISSIQKNLAESEEKYTFLALHDAVTGLPNRRSLMEDANSILTDGNNVALLFIDMDNFKYINDTMGHEFGDELIMQASCRLSLSLDEVSTLYRLGGDEFILMKQGIKDRKEAEKLLSDILYSFREEFVIKNSALHISFSIGLALYPEHGENIAELIKSADIAMYKAKEGGRNRYQIYEKSMNKAFVERMSLEKHLHAAMERNEFELYFQPQLNLSSNKVTGLEALLRWKSPDLGSVSPMKFVKVAEDTHLIIPLGEWVLIQACEFLSKLNKNGYNDLIISVNISILQILQADFIDKVIQILDNYDIDPHYLELEITETVLIESFDAVYGKLHQLSLKGIGIALDDFGKGYSSLSYLKQLPITTLKIDKSFIDNITTGSDNASITRHIITLGRALGMSVIAEGVEDEIQLEYLKKYQCDRIQGHLFSKALPKNELVKLLEDKYPFYPDAAV